MGYRSTVGIYIARTFGDAPSVPEALALAKAKGAISEATFAEYWSSDSFGWDNETFVFYVEDVKWYSTYKEVTAIEALYQFFEEMVDEAGRNQFDGKFCRIGEESNDIEDKYFGDGTAWDNMYVSRSIEFNGGTTWEPRKT